MADRENLAPKRGAIYDWRTVRTPCAPQRLSENALACAMLQRDERGPATNGTLLLAEALLDSAAAVVAASDRVVAAIDRLTAETARGHAGRQP